MAGFIDKNTRILDMVLTNYGKKLLSDGNLNFCYWTAFDDEIDYDPFISTSSSLSEEELLEAVYTSIETTPIREATSGYRSGNKIGEDRTNLNNPMFTVPQGQEILPRSVFPDDSTREVETLQRRIIKVFSAPKTGPNNIPHLEPVDIGIERFIGNKSGVTLELAYENDSFPTDFQPEGFHITVLKSGSSGYTEVSPRYDLKNDLTFGNEIRILPDSEES